MRVERNGPSAALSSSILSQARGQLLYREIAEHSAAPLSHSPPSSPGYSHSNPSSECELSCLTSFQRSLREETILGACVGWEAQEDGGKMQGGTGRQGDGCGWGLSLPTSSPLIWRPRIEPPINKSKSYLNTLPFSTDWGLWASLIIAFDFKGQEPHNIFPLIELLFLEWFQVFTDGITTNRSFGFLAY